MTVTVTEDYEAFDDLWDRKGQRAAIMSLPTYEDVEPFHTSTHDACSVCGEVPETRYYPRYRTARTFWQWLTRKTPSILSHATEFSICDCWEPDSQGDLETR
jgi:hypothetical protein